MRLVPDNTHCLRHAHSYPMDEKCPHCELEKVRKKSVGEYFEDWISQPRPLAELKMK